MIGCLMNAELEKICKELFMASFKVLTFEWPKKTKKNSQDNWSQRWDVNLEFSEY